MMKTVFMKIWPNSINSKSDMFTAEHIVVTKNTLVI